MPLLSCSVNSGVQDLLYPPPLAKEATEFTSACLCLGESDPLLLEGLSHTAALSSPAWTACGHGYEKMVLGKVTLKV